MKANSDFKQRGQNSPEVPHFRRMLFVKHVLLISVVVLLTTGILGHTGYVVSREILRDQIDQRLTVVASDRRRMVENYTAQQLDQIGLLASRTRLRELIATYQQQNGRPDPPMSRDSFLHQTQRILRDAQQSTKNVLEIWVTDPQGNVLTSTNSSQLGNTFADDPDFLRGRKARYLSTPQRVDGRYVGHLAAPAFDGEGRLAGVIMARVDMSRLFDILSDSTGLGETGAVLVAVRSGSNARYLFPFRPEQQSSVAELSDVPAMGRAIAGETGFMHTKDYRGKDVLAAYRPVRYEPLGDQQWGLVAYVHESEAYAPVRQLQQILFALQAGAVLVGIAGAIWLSRHLTRPIRNLARSAKLVAGGDFSVRVPVKTRDEIGTLTLVFNQMTEVLGNARADLERRVSERTRELHEAQRDLRRQVKQTRQIVDTAHDAFVAMDSAGRIVDWNPQAETTFGWAINDVKGRTVAELLIPPELRASHEKGLRRFLATGKGPVLDQRIELTARHRDGHEFPVELAVTAIPQGETFLFAAFCHDISERKRAEEQLNDTAEKLKRSNEELQQFAYVASHDLQEPLRAIAGYCQLLQRRYAGQLGEKADEYIRQAVDGAERMQTLINGLLTYSRVSTRGKEFQAVDLEETLRLVLANLARAIDESEAQITHDPLPLVMGDPTQLNQLLQNLIGNALKYRSDRRPEIHIAAEKESEEWRIAVRDNGIGIAPRHFERVFRMFQRLHTREEYAGTGIGLAVCKRIVERHGGRIWIESTPGEGSTFIFTIPIREEVRDVAVDEEQSSRFQQRSGTGAAH